MLRDETGVDALAHRVRALERQIRWMKACLAGALGLVLVGPLASVRGSGIPELVEARRFVVKDAAGTVRGELGLDKAGKGGHFVVYGSDGNSMFEAGENLVAADSPEAPDDDDALHMAGSPIPGVASLEVKKDSVLVRADPQGGAILEAPRGGLVKRGDSFTVRMGPAVLTYTLKLVDDGEAVFAVRDRKGGPSHELRFPPFGEEP